MSLLSQLPPFETLAVVLAIAYLVLAARENIICWYCAFISSTIYVVLFWNVSLLMESMLNIYYMVMAIYGWQQWRFGGKAHDGIPITTLSIRSHTLILSVILFMTAISGYFLSQHTSAAWPYIDSFTTWSSIVTTIMVAKKILENWLYWIIIDSISIFLYIDRELYLTAVLFAVYLVIVVYGYFSWRERLHASNVLAVNSS